MSATHQLALNFDGPPAHLVPDMPGEWDKPVIPEGDPIARVKRITKLLADDYRSFGGWGRSLEDSLDVILAVLESREDDYMSLVNGMKSEALVAVCGVFAELLEGFCMDYNIWDYLGGVYMELGSHSKHQAFGQFFTPTPVCEMMAEMSITDIPSAIHRARLEGRRMTVHDPACGSGAMLLGAKRAIVRQAGLSGLDWFAFSGTDLDPICVKMCKVQSAMTEYRFMCNWMLVKGYEAASARKSKNTP